MIKVLFILILGMFFMGCDPVVYYHFVVKNNTTSGIKISYKKIEKDTALFIKPNEAVILVSSLEITHNPNEDYYKTIVDAIYPTISVTKNTDSLNIDIWKRENWEFRLKDTLERMYVLNLREKHFKNTYAISN